MRKISAGFAELVEAYRSTRYRVVSSDDAVEAEAMIDMPSRELDLLLARHGAGCAVFITAWNPRSEAQGRAVNEAAQRRLEHELRLRGTRFLPHVGVGADPAWEAERGVLALDLPPAEALALAVAYGQHAVVAVEPGQPARLLLTELMPALPAG